MRKFINSIVLTTAVLISVHSCYIDERPFQNPVQEGIPVRVSLSYSSSGNVVETRSALPPEYENRIENIYLFVFNSAGVRQPLLNSIESGEERSSLFVWGGEGSGGLQPGNDDHSYGSLEFVCGSLSNATIVAVANVTTEDVSTAYTVTPEELDKIEYLDSLKEKIMNMERQSVGRGALFMMTGYAMNEGEDEDGGTSIDISGNENGDAVLSCTLKLERTDAKVEVQLTSGVPEGKNWSDFSFRPLTWQVVNVPAQSYILLNGEGKDAEGSYFSTTASELDTLRSNENGTLYEGGAFSFYMPENLKRVKDGVNIQSYEEREKWITSPLEGGTSAGPGHSENNISFEYAPEKSTYLIITGQVSYKDALGYSVSADTRYYIHLGYGSGDPNDFLTKRNHHYIYNVHVQGINDIIVEVEQKGQEPERPGHEGEVVYSSSGLFEFDCHYDRRLIRLHRDSLLSEDLSWGVSTPFSKGIHVVDVNEDDRAVPADLLDYRWIKFAVNKHYGVENNKFVKYPGDQNYNDPYPRADMEEGVHYNAEAPYYNRDTSPWEDPVDYPDARLMDINQLLKYLKQMADDDADGIFDSNGYVSISVFVDENLYTYDPRAKNPEAITQESLTNYWKQSVNQQDRMLHIISRGAQYSPDGNSSVVSTLYTFKQKSIRTIYNPDPDLEDLKTAWGLEANMETGRLKADYDRNADSEDNGRENTWEYLEPFYGALEWTDVLSTDENGHYTLNEDYQNTFYACLIRNRDLNGDNKVDENEVRWYLASINQLTDIFIGEYALDYESRLYPYDPVNKSYPPNGKTGNVCWHYASSTCRSYTQNFITHREPYVVWAEEGPSKGNYESSSLDKNNGEYYSYRCIRNLGIPLDDLARTPDELIKCESLGNNVYEFDLSRLDPKALRSYYVSGSNTFPAHNEKSSHNLPRKSFEVSLTRYGNNLTWSEYQEENPCEDAGYRLPNLRELLIFTSRLSVPNNGMIMSNTSFSMCGFPPYDETRKGYSYNSGDGSMGPADHNGYVYGVKDLE